MAANTPIRIVEDAIEQEGTVMSVDEVLQTLDRPRSTANLSDREKKLLPQTTDLLSYYDKLGGTTTNGEWGTHRMLDIASLSIDPVELQRSCEREEIIELAEHFDKSAFGAATVCEIEDDDGETHLFIQDGQERVCAARLRGIKKVPCIVHLGSTKEHAKYIFLVMNNVRKAVGKTPNLRIAGQLDKPTNNPRVDRLAREGKMVDKFCQTNWLLPIEKENGGSKWSKFQEMRKDPDSNPRLAQVVGVSGIGFIKEMLIKHKKDPTRWVDPARVVSIYRLTFPTHQEWSGTHLRALFFFISAFPNIIGKAKDSSIRKGIIKLCGNNWKKVFHGGSVAIAKRISRDWISEVTAPKLDGEQCVDAIDKWLNALKDKKPMDQFTGKSGV